MFGVVHRHAGGRIDLGILHLHPGREFDALLDLAHAREVLVELLLVAAIEIGVHRLRIGEHVIEDGVLLGLPAAQVGHALLRGTVPEQALEHEARIVLGRQRLVVRAPGHVVFVGAGVARIAVTGLAHGVAAQLQRRETRVVPDLVGHHLVDGDAGMDVGAGGLLDTHTREERGARARVVARAIGARVCAEVVETADHLQMLVYLREGRQRGREREIRAAFAGGPPGFGYGAIRHVDESHALRCEHLAGRECLARHHGRHGGQGDGSSGAAQEFAPRETVVALGCELRWGLGGVVAHGLLSLGLDPWINSPP